VRKREKLGWRKSTACRRGKRVAKRARKDMDRGMIRATTHRGLEVAKIPSAG